MLENNINDPLYNQNETLNGNFTLTEISEVVMKAESRTACGYDEIPYFVLKCPALIAILKELFQLIFYWYYTNSMEEINYLSHFKRLNVRPLHYRGVRLLSYISKLYTGLINKRLTKYFDENNILQDEQNGFRRNRSCEDHVFSLSGVIRNNNEVFASFIDLRKCFDFTDIEMLLYKLYILKGIDGKIH